MSTKAQRRKAWESWATREEISNLSDKTIALSIEFRIYELGDNPRQSDGWYTMMEAKRRPSMVPFLVSLKLKGLL